MLKKLSFFVCFGLFFTTLASAQSHFPHTSAESTLRQKIGQMLILGFNGKILLSTSPILKAIQEQQIGGVVLFDLDYFTHQQTKNIESPQQVKLLVQQLKQTAYETAKTHHNQLWPLLVSIDYEGGRDQGATQGVNRLKTEYGFPATLSALKITQLPWVKAQTLATQMAQILAELGINVNYAPVLDLNRNPENPIIGRLERSFSHEPATVIRYANLFSRTLHQHGVVCAYKHFPGQGSAKEDSHLGFVDVSDTWQKVELIPYQKLLRQATHCEIVMSAHLVNRQLDSSGLPATLSSKILTDVLRKQLNFKGVIMTDDLQMKAISDQYSLEQTVIQAINAGADILLFANQLVKKPINPAKIIALIEKAVKTKQIPQARIESAFLRIQKLKAGLRQSH